MPLQLATLKLATLQLATLQLATMTTRQSPPLQLATLTTRHSDNSPLWQLATLKTRHPDNSPLWKLATLQLTTMTTRQSPPWQLATLTTRRRHYNLQLVTMAYMPGSFSLFWLFLLQCLHCTAPRIFPSIFCRFLVLINEISCRTIGFYFSLDYTYFYYYPELLLVSNVKPIEKYLASKPQTRTKCKLNSQGKLTMPRCENQKFRKENVILKANGRLHKV
jgi:hypothetical protein